MPKKSRAISARHEGGGRHNVQRRRRGFLIGLAAVGALLVVVVLAGAWVGIRALDAKASLEAAQTLVTNIRAEATDQDFDGAVADAALLRSETANAVDKTSDPVWRVAEFVPVVGSNLTAVRQLAAAVDSVAVDAIDPIMDIASGGLDAFKPVDGRIDVAVVQELSTAVATADDVLTSAEATVNAVDTSSTLPQVTAAVNQLSGLLADATKLTGDARTPLSLLGPMLGADGPRNYIVLFQNNAESTSFGGNSSTWLVLNVDNGAISITAQPNSLDFSRELGTPMEIPAETLAAFDDPGYFGYATNITIRPDFPFDGQLAQAFWQRQSGQVVDGVIAFDPIALSYLLGATGPLTLPSGQTLTEANTVKLLLSDVYATIPKPEDQDLFYAEAAGAIFGALTERAPNPARLIPALGRAIDDNRLMVWSAEPEEQAVIATTHAAGILPTDNVEKTQVGIFFTDASAGKVSYYLKTAATVTDTSCSTPDAPTYSASISLHSDITPEAYKKLPYYVRAGGVAGNGITRTLVMVYGPPGATFTDYTWDGAGVGGTEVTAVGTDLGRPTVQIAVYLRPGESSTVGASFSAPPGEYGPLDVRATPMVNPTEITLVTPGC